MNNYYVIELQSNHDGTAAHIVTAYQTQGAAEDAYLAARRLAALSSVMVHTIMYMDNRGNVIEKKCYVHPAPAPEPEEEPTEEQ